MHTPSHMHFLPFPTPSHGSLPPPHVHTLTHALSSLPHTLTSPNLSLLPTPSPCTHPHTCTSPYPSCFPSLTPPSPHLHHAHTLTNALLLTHPASPHSLPPPHTLTMHTPSPGESTCMPCYWVNFHSAPHGMARNDDSDS